MSIHIGAEQGQIAPTVLLPGDPLRAKNIAETMLVDVICFNQVRGMLGFTGRYGDKRVSVMGSGMETNALYTLAAKFKVSALSVLTVSDSLVTGESSTAEQRERDFPQMAEITPAIVP